MRYSNGAERLSYSEMYMNKLSQKLNNLVLMAQENWRSINETLYLMSIPKVRDSLIEPVSESELVDESDVDL